MPVAAVLGLVLFSTTALAQSRVPRVRSRSVGKSVSVDAGASTFRVEHSWEVTGASRLELMAVRHRLTLTGPAGMFGASGLLRTETPWHLQNDGRGVDAHGVRPFMLWAQLGSRARTRPTASGFEASMSEGIVGRGVSQVVIGATRWQAGGPVTLVHESGEYTLRLETEGLLAPFAWGWSLVAATPFGQAGLTPALYGMGALHNEVFDAGGALAGAVNAERSKRGR